MPAPPNRYRMSRDTDSDAGGDSGDEDDFEKEEPQVDTSFKQVIIVDGLPMVPTEKREKLVNVVRKVFSQVGTIVDGSIEMPVDAALTAAPSDASLVALRQ